MPDYAAMKVELPKLKAALTRAQKKGPEAVLAEVTRAFERFEVIGYPDCWSMWERAKDDAKYEAQRQGRYRGWGG